MFQNKMESVVTGRNNFNWIHCMEQITIWLLVGLPQYIKIKEESKKLGQESPSNENMTQRTSHNSFLHKSNAMSSYPKIPCCMLFFWSLHEKEA